MGFSECGSWIPGTPIEWLNIIAELIVETNMYGDERSDNCNSVI